MTAWDPKGGSYDCDPNALPLRGGLLTHRVRADSDAYGITRPLRGRPFDRRAREPADGRHPATDLEPLRAGADRPPRARLVRLEGSPPAATRHLHAEDGHVVRILATRRDHRAQLAA